MKTFVAGAVAAALAVLLLGRWLSPEDSEAKYATSGAVVRAAPVALSSIRRPPLAYSLHPRRGTALCFVGASIIQTVVSTE